MIFPAYMNLSECYPIINREASKYKWRKESISTWALVSRPTSVYYLC